jgi:2-polyprenyl-3-methyl-5-hydroxy-6-metoxy-1,4-benzoquinol methylase
LAISKNQSPKDHTHEPELKGYTSNALRLFVKGLEEMRAGQILDVGPVCNENINFLAQRVKRLYVCDMFIRLDQVKREELPLQKTWRYLDYPSGSFDGILLWDLVDRLDDREVGRLKKHCHRMVRNNGMVVVIALSQQEITPVVNSFFIRDNYLLSLRPQLHLDLPLHIRQNREVLKLLSPFSAVKSFIYRNGIREFLFRRK